MSPHGHVIVACHYVRALALSLWKTIVDLCISRSPAWFDDATAIIRITCTHNILHQLLETQQNHSTGTIFMHIPSGDSRREVSQSTESG